MVGKGSVLSPTPWSKTAPVGNLKLSRVQLQSPSSAAGSRGCVSGPMVGAPACSPLPLPSFLHPPKALTLIAAIFVCNGLVGVGSGEQCPSLKTELNSKPDCHCSTQI